MFSGRDFRFLCCSLVVCFNIVYGVISLIMDVIRICLMGPESISMMRLIRISMMGLAPHEHFNNYTPNHHPIPCTMYIGGFSLHLFLMGTFSKLPSNSKSFWYHCLDDQNLEKNKAIKDGGSTAGLPTNNKQKDHQSN